MEQLIMNTVIKIVLLLIVINNLKSIGRYLHDYSMSNNTNIHFKTLFFGAMIFFIVFFFLSIFFFLERTVFIDIAYHTFYLIKNQAFVPNYRFGAALSQILPLLTIKLGLPLNYVLVAYSISFVLLYLLIFLIITVLLKNIQLGWVLIGYLTLLMSDTFYWVQSEYQQGCALCLLFFGILLYQQKSNSMTWGIFNVILLVTVVFMHPLIIFVIGFLFVYFYLNRNISLSIAALYAILSVIIWIVKSIFFKIPYDEGKMAGMNNILSLFPDYFKLTSIQSFFSTCLNDYLLFAILSVVVLVYFLYSKQFSKSLCFVFFLIGYWFLIVITNPDSANDYYIQNMYLPMGIMIFTPLLFEIVPLVSNKAVAVSVIGYLFIRFYFIVDAHFWFTERITWNKKLIEQVRSQEKGNRFMIAKENVPMEILGNNWASSYETLLLSSVNNPDSAITIIIHDNPSQFQWLKRNDAFVTEWDIWYGKDIPQKYFNINNSYYKILDRDFK